jgi:hypothetical protein
VRHHHGIACWGANEALTVYFNTTKLTDRNLALKRVLGFRPLARSIQRLGFDQMHRRILDQHDFLFRHVLLLQNPLQLAQATQRVSVL